MQYIDGQWVTGQGAAWQTHDAITQVVTWEGHAASATQVAAAIAAARQAFPAWAQLTFEQRVLILHRFAEQLKQQQATLAEIIASETGKPLWEANTEVVAMIGKIDISLEAYQQRTGNYEKPLTGMVLKVEHRPHGVFAILGPFNFPGHLPNGHIVPALLAGNTLVFKPSNYTPRTAIALVKAWNAAGLPKGVLNLILGDSDIGQALIQPAAIDGVLFTGSYRTGKAIHQQFAGFPEKILALEMGGNNPLIVWDVVDIKAAAYMTIQSAFITAGQRCTCARRLIIPANQQGDVFLQTLLAYMTTMTIGHWQATPEPFMGPVIAIKAAQDILMAQQQLLENGGIAIKPLTMMQANSSLLTPGLIDVSKITQVQDKEIFGPLLQVIRVKDFSAAMRAANNTHYGLAAGLLSDNKQYFDIFMQQIRAGAISYNRPTTGASSVAPFGGIGWSGNHRPSAFYAADYCAYPMAGSINEKLVLPEKLTPGIHL
jgi:succinylglutamic semialdehyde dehydrogenase